MSTCVVIAGTYRSGTSLLARFLHESGVDMNPVPMAIDLPGWHPSGSYRDSILESQLFIGWEDYFAKRNVLPIWGVKSHMLLFQQKMLKDFLDSCPASRKVLVWTTRDQLQSAQSFQSLRKDLTIDESFEIISQQSIAIQDIFLKWPEGDKISIQFPDVTVDPELQLKEVCNLIGVPFSQSACAHIKSDIPKWS